MQTSRNYLSRRPSYSQLCPKICCHGKGRNVNDTIGKPRPENRRVGAHSAQLSFTGTELYRFEISIGRNAIFFKLGENRGRSYQTFVPNKLDLTFRASNHCAKFYHNRMKVAVVGVFTDRLTE